VKIVFFGSGAFAIPSFEALFSAGHHVLALVTQPDTHQGRGRALASPPLKPVAEAHRVSVLQPRRVRDPEAIESLRALRPEIQVVVAYGQILPRAALEIAPRGAVNVHASLLPLYRGAAPIQRAIAAGETQTGVTTMLLDEGLDTGPLLLAHATPIEPEETAAELQERLARLGAGLLVETLLGLASGRILPRAQDHTQASHAPLLSKEEGRIDWMAPARLIHQRVRGFAPWPGAFTSWHGLSLKILRAQLMPDATGEAGTLQEIAGDALVVCCGDGTRLGLLEVQLEGRRRVSGAAFAAGARLEPGARFA
jgi:methionyl-tRNA formyltransferase